MSHNIITLTFIFYFLFTMFINELLYLFAIITAYEGCLFYLRHVHHTYHDTHLTTWHPSNIACHSFMLSVYLTITYDDDNYHPCLMKIVAKQQRNNFCSTLHSALRLYYLFLLWFWIFFQVMRNREKKKEISWWREKAEKTMLFFYVNNNCFI